jgi:putative transposase
MDYSKTTNKLEKLHCGSTYHIYNKAISHEKLFLISDDYFYFLKKLNRYILPVANIIAYCLIPNHFHLLVTIKDRENIPRSLLKGKVNPDQLVSKSFSNLFNSYTKSFNIVHNRAGRLFLYLFKRILVENEDYFACLINYIHRNPVHHGIVKNYDDWKYSSYHAYLSELPTHINRKEGLSLFSSLDDFIRFHQENKSVQGIEKYYFE